MAPPPRVPVLRLESRPGRMPAIDAAGFLLGVALLVAARFVPQLISPLAFWLLATALAAGFGVDLLFWFRRGVHAIELDGDTLILHRGRRRFVHQRIERASVRSVSLRRNWGGQAIEIRLLRPSPRAAAHRPDQAPGRPIPRLPWRGRLLLRDDAFDREAFARLAGLLNGWNRRGA